MAFSEIESSFLDFKGLIEKWEGLQDKLNPSTCLYHDQLGRIKEFPDLLGSNIDPMILGEEKNKLGFGLILSSLFPLAGQESNKYLAISKPFDNRPIYATASFSELFISPKGEIKIPEKFDLERVRLDKLVHVYNMILHQFYGIEMNKFPPVIYQFRGENGVMRHFHIKLNTEFVRVHARGSIPQLEDQAEFCKHKNPIQFEIEKLLTLLPLELFEFHGFMILEAHDVTVPQSVAILNEAVLQQDQASQEEFVQIVEDTVKSLLNRGGLKVGLAVLQNLSGKYVMSQNRLASSFLFSQLATNESQRSYDAIVEFLSKVDKPVYLKDFQSMEDGSPVMQKLLGLGLNEMILFPLKHVDKLVGVLEICAFGEDMLNPLMMHSLDQLAPSLSLALYRQAEKLDNQVKAIIKKNFTAIHPVVEWKFDEIALDYALEEEEGGKAEIKPILFEDVYPLYAAIDVKNSTQKRNQAIHDDFVIQLDSAREILKLSKNIHDFSLLDSLIDQIDEFKEKINLILLTEEEIKITDFFQRELEPIFLHLKDSYPELKDSIQSYFNSLDPQLHIVNRHRKAFELNLISINQVIGTFMDEQEAKIQKVFPHYFEKFKTDGIEYNIYIGQSLVKNKDFNVMYLKNLRLWQLESLIEVYHLIEEKKTEMENPIEITQLILAHSTPISISFRLDERKFDVEGAYNIRYEIMKKRIDKALVLGSKERLVQPGKIAIVYSQAKEAKEYLGYINYLQKKRELQSEVEELELEEMQGVYGLKALRVAVAPKSDQVFNSSSKLISEGKEG